MLSPSRPLVHAEEVLPLCDSQYKRSVENEYQGFIEVCEYLDERDIPCYDMTEDFIVFAENHEERLFFEADAHWTSLGHEFFARKLAEYIIENDLLQ